MLDFVPSEEDLNQFYNYAINNGDFIDKHGFINLNKVLCRIKKPKFSDLLSLYGFLHCTGAWEDNGEILYGEEIPFQDLISCREDVYAYVYRKLNTACCENPSGLAFEIKENVRKGKYFGNRMPVEVEHLLLESEIPEWYIESMKKIKYLFPKTHSIVFLKQQIYKFIQQQ